jgi:hypothetical protein
VGIEFPNTGELGSGKVPEQVGALDKKIMQVGGSHHIMVEQFRQRSTAAEEVLLEIGAVPASFLDRIEVHAHSNALIPVHTRIFPHRPERPEQKTPLIKGTVTRVDGDTNVVRIQHMKGVVIHPFHKQKKN